MKTFLVSLFLLIGIISAQTIELSSICLDDCVASSTASSSHHDSDENTQDSHHCHHSCFQCHQVLINQKLVSFSEVAGQLSSEYYYSVSFTSEYPISFDRPPIQA